MEAITNKSVFLMFKDKGKSITLNYIIEHLKQKNIPMPTEQSIVKKIENLNKQYQKINKSKSRSNYEMLLNNLNETQFIIPKCSPVEPKNKNKVQTDSSKFMCEAFNLATTSAVTELNICREECCKLLRSNKILSSQLRNVKRQNVKLNTTLRSVQSERQHVKHLKRQLQLKAHDNKLLRLKVSYSETKTSKLKNRVYDANNNTLVNESDNKYLQDTVDSLQNDLKEKKSIESDLLKENEWLSSLIDDNNLFYTFDNDKRSYTTDIQQCVYQLLDHNVSVRKVSLVIEAVLKLVKKEPSKLPCKTTIINMSLQRLPLARLHIAEVFSAEENTCLLTDETSKKGSKYMGYETCDSNGKFWVLGLRDISTKSASDTLKVFKEILSDIDSICGNQDDKSCLILKHIVATMSDRAATEVKFNTLLEEFRSGILPLLNDLPDEQQEAVAPISNFFCGLHSLVHIAEGSNKALIEAENALFAGKDLPKADPFFNNSESFATRLTRTASKAFAAGADEKSGCFSSFSIFVKPFLKEKGLLSIPLTPFRGSRFNVLFANAASVFFLRKQMLDFLEQCGAENRLLKSVLMDLKMPEIVGGIKCLGLISVFLTCPLWRTIEDKNINILDMNTKYLEFLTVVEEAAENPRRFMEGQIIFNENTVYICRDHMTIELLKPSEVDEFCELSLRIVLPAISVVCKRVFTHHLPGGIHTNMDTQNQELRDRYKCVPKSSVFAESVFGQLDYILKQKPNVTTIAAESYLMFAQNKTSVWLNSKDTNEQTSLILQARKEGRKILKKFYERKQSITEERRQILNEKIRKKEEQELKKQADKETFTSEIIEFGLWQNEMEVDNQIQSYVSKSHKIRAVKAQLRFRQHVLQQKTEDNSVYYMSKSGVPLTVQELSDNVKKLVRKAMIHQNSLTGNSPNTHILCGKRVSHKFQDDGEEHWHSGRVISQVPGYPHWFNVAYDKEEGIIYSYKLEEDYGVGDLRIIV